jgi:predicted Rossmann-fold nucleotide-binding protein
MPSTTSPSSLSSIYLWAESIEELYEVWTWAQLGYHDQPIGLLNIQGYYDNLLRFMRHSVTEGFLSVSQHTALKVDVDPEALLLELAQLALSASAADDFTEV